MGGAYVFLSYRYECQVHQPTLAATNGESKGSHKKAEKLLCLMQTVPGIRRGVKRSHKVPLVHWSYTWALSFT